MKLTAEVQMMLEQKIIPFWLSLQDDHYGGFVSYVDLNLRRNEKAEKGCILNSRILWFFSEAAMLQKAVQKAVQKRFDRLPIQAMPSVKSSVSTKVRLWTICPHLPAAW